MSSVITFKTINWNLFTNKYSLEYGTIVEDAITVEDSEETTLHCSIRGYHIAAWSTTMEN